MAEIIRLPRMSDTMTEGKIVSWQKKVGDNVKAGDVLAEIETDKATMELESYSTGVLLYIGSDKGSTVAVDGVLAIIGKEGEAYQDLLTSPAPTNAPITNAPPIPTTTEALLDPVKLGVTVLRMPLLSDTMTEGKVVKWNKKVGDDIKSDESIADVETDKATMEVIPYVSGVLLYTSVREGEKVAINGLLALIGKRNTNIDELVRQLQAPQQTPINPAPNPTVSKDEKPSLAPVTSSTPATNGRIKISPLARTIALHKGIDLSALVGSGTEGRIIKKDVEGYTIPSTLGNPIALEKSKQNDHTAYPTRGYEDIPISQMRKTIARRLSESKFGAPHFYLTMKVLMDKALESRKILNEQAKEKISFNDMVIKASAIALKKHPSINSSWLGDKIRINYDVHIGVAVAIPDGLLVPVIKHADQKSLSEIGSEVRLLASKAKDKTLLPKEWEGNTFTISNLGMTGIDSFTAIINPPDACILAVGAILQEPIVHDGEVRVGHTMKLTLSCDHRVVDGMTGASFLQTLKAYLEEPLRMML